VYCYTAGACSDVRELSPVSSAKCVAYSKDDHSIRPYYQLCSCAVGVVASLTCFDLIRSSSGILYASLYCSFGSLFRRAAGTRIRLC
jgi:hypothetical protein